MTNAWRYHLLSFVVWRSHREVPWRAVIKAEHGRGLSVEPSLPSGAIVAQSMVKPQRAKCRPAAAGSYQSRAGLFAGALSHAARERLTQSDGWAALLGP